jgi:hypothetical protein
VLGIPFAAIATLETDPVGDDDVFCSDGFGLDTFGGGKGGEFVKF